MAAEGAFDAGKAMDDIFAFTAGWEGSLVSIQQYLYLPGSRARLVTCLQFLFDAPEFGMGSGTIDFNVRGGGYAGWCGVALDRLVSVEFSGEDTIALFEDLGQQVRRQTRVRREAAEGHRSDGRAGD